MNQRVIVIGASAGGIQASRKLLAHLPDNLEAAVFIVIHTHPDSPGLLAQILDRAGDLPVSYAEHQQRIENGRVYVAPPDRHLLIDGDRMLVIRGPKENYHRPAVDPLFRTAAVHYGPNATGIILTGKLNDGTSGAAAIRECGGRIIVQDPEEAEAPGMPQSVLKHVGADHCVHLCDIGPLTLELMRSPSQRPGSGKPSGNLILEAGIPSMHHQEDDVVDKLGCRTTLTCPECQGILWEIKDEHLLRYRCHVGHAYTAEFLASDQAVALERALYVALKSLGECKTLALRLAYQAEKEGDPTNHRLLQEKAEGLAAAGDQIRLLLAKDGDPAMEAIQ